MQLLFHAAVNEQFSRDLVGVVRFLLFGHLKQCVTLGFGDSDALLHVVPWVPSRMVAWLR